ncbi:MAG: site-specific integrase [Paludibacteraceae bacterium]|nr:site-specific integrase [Paludibacteraceae bacterium]
MLSRIAYRPVFNRAARLNMSGKGLIEIECRQSGRRIYFSTNTYVGTDQWKHGRVINHPLADGLNHSIWMSLLDIQRVELEFLKRGVYLSLPALKNAVRAKIKPTATLVEFGNEIINGSERKQTTIAGYRTLFRNIEKFRAGVLVADIDYSFLVSYENWMRALGIAHNTRVGRLCFLRTIMNEAVRHKIIDSSPFAEYKIPPMTAREGFLTNTQLHKVEKVDVKDKAAIIRDAFLFACYTGLRFSDLVTLRSEHIVKQWIHKKMVKTGFMVDVPLNDIFASKAAAIIERYGTIERLVTKIGCNSTANKRLREILQQVGITEHYTFHTARHTFATLLIQYGLAITTVQRLLGHQRIETTQIYGEITTKAISADIRRANRKHNQ